MSETRNLAVALRPNRLSDLVGYQHVVAQMRETARQGRVPTAILLLGDPGAGKTTIARILARSVQCDHSPVFGDPCKDCQEETLFDIDEKNTSSFNGVDDIREMISGLYMMPQVGKKKVPILDECQRLTEPAQNALLKVLENPPSTVLFILGTSDPTKLLPALKRRCIDYHLPGLDPIEIKQLVLRTLQYDRKPLPSDDVKATELTEALIVSQVTSPGLIVKATERVLAGVRVQDAALVDEVTSIDTRALNIALQNGNWEQTARLMTQVKPSDVRAIRRSVAGWFRMLLLKTAPGRRALICSQVIDEMSRNSTYEDSVQLAAVCGAFYRTCVLITEAKDAKKA